MKATLKFRGVEEDTREQFIIDLPLVCYDAPVEADLLLSYDWLAQMHLDVLPRRHGLRCTHGESQIWIAGIDEGRPTSPSPAQINAIEGKVGQSTRDYCVRPEFFREICDQLGLKPTVDAFATATNTTCSRYVTKELMN